jgi:hypothetical protein
METSLIGKVSSQEYNLKTTVKIPLETQLLKAEMERRPSNIKTCNKLDVSIGT